MTTIKLSEWCAKSGVAYITAYRWFRANKFPVYAYQTDTGTILVEDTYPDTATTVSPTTNDAMSVFLKKTVEFSKNNSTVEDFAAYVISNFQLKLNTATEGPRYSKVKPKPEEVQKHFQQFIPDKEKSEQLKAAKETIREQGIVGMLPPEVIDQMVETENGLSQEDWDKAGALLSSMAPQISNVHLYGPKTAVEGLVMRSVDSDTTPQSINYTDSATNQAFNSTSSLVDATNSFVAIGGDFGGTFTNPTNVSWDSPPLGMYLNSRSSVAAVPFLPTQKEILSASQVIETAEGQDVPRKRGRKPTLMMTKKR